MLPWKPEPESQLIARVDDALAACLPDVLEPGEHPGDDRRNCFHFEDGLVVIITRRTIQGPTKAMVDAVMVVAMREAGSPNHTLVADAEFPAYAEKKVRLLLGTEMGPVRYSPQQPGFPQWVMPWWWVNEQRSKFGG
jgi:hypothetical protein